MSIYEVISGVLLIIVSLCIVAVTISQSKKDQGMTSAITGASNDSFYGKNAQNTKEAKLARLTKVSAIVFFVVTVIVNVVPIIFKAA